MSFALIEITGRRLNTAPLRYRIRYEQGKLRLHFAVANELLAQVKGDPGYWRLDLDHKAKRGRLTGLVQNDGNPATRKKPVQDKACASFTWGITEKALQHFPDLKKVTVLKVHEVTSLGIEFDIPA